MSLNDEQTASVYEALGAASACWESLQFAGVFESDRCQEIGVELCRKIESWIDGSAQLDRIEAKLNLLLEAEETLSKERAELAEHMKASGIGAIFEALNGQ